MKTVMATLGGHKYLKATLPRMQVILGQAALELDRRCRRHPRVIEGLQDQGWREWRRSLQQLRQG